MWPFRRHERAGRGGGDDATGHVLSWAKRTLNDPVSGIPPVPGLLDSPTDVSDTDAERLDWRSSVQDPSESGWGSVYAKIAKEPDGDGARAEPSTTIVVVTTQSPEASEGEAHIFGDAQEAKRFVERLIDDGFDRERIKTIRGGQTQLRVSSRAVVDFD
jgi:hypothetical protein